MDKSAEWRDFIPVLLAVLVTLIAPHLLPSELRNIAPPLGLAVIFFYLRRGGFPLWAAVICGVLLEILQAMPLGVGVSAALLLYALARRREERQEASSFARNAFRHFWVSALVMLWIYLLMSLTQAQFFPIAAPLLQWLALGCSYPLIYAFCHAMHRPMSKSIASHL
ncbi:MAG: hypothetical protein P8P30_00960 [Rickettsiales bacterium]|nr:hypothetical protein [Rickettsiales bacterium]